MKKLSIILSIIIVLCFGCFSGCGIVTYETYANSENYQVGSFSFKKDDIEKANIFWESGEIKLTTKVSEEFRVYESGKNLKNEQKLHYIIENKVLTVRFCDSGYIGSLDSDDKVLFLELPENIDINVKIASGEISGKNVLAKDVNLSSSSGEIDIESIKASNLSIKQSSGETDVDIIECDSNAIIESSSGNIEVKSVVASVCSLQSASGEIDVDMVKTTTKLTAYASSGDIEIKNVDTKELEVKTVSGSPTISIKRCENGTIDATSGEIELSLLDNFGAKILTTLTSGRFKTKLDYATTTDGYKVFNNGSCLLQLSTTSGNIIVK